MSRPTIFVCSSLALFAVPSVAAAQESGGFLSAPPVSMIVSLVGLGVAVILLLEAMAVRRVARGGAIAEKISYVVLAVVCLAASALAQWGRNFVGGVTLDQIQFASQVLVITAMGLLAAYFAGVRRALQGYLTAMTGGEALAAEAASTDSDEATRG
jgi:hypothetical protein